MRYLGTVGIIRTMIVILALAFSIPALSAQVTAPVPPKSGLRQPEPLKAAPLPDEGKLPSTVMPLRTRRLTATEESVIEALLREFLENMDIETRHGCGDKEHPRFFPQRPRLAFMYKGGGFMPETWLGFRIIARKTAPAVVLVPWNEITAETFVLDVLKVEAKEPLARATYRHSGFTFGSAHSSQPIFGGPGRDLPGSVFTIEKDPSEAVFSFFYEKDRENGREYASAKPLLIGKGNFARIDREEREAKKIKDAPELIRAIAEGIRKFELTLPEEYRMGPLSNYDRIEEWVSAEDHSPRSAAPNLAVAILEMMLPKDSIIFAGHYREYLVEKKGDEWTVLDSNTVSFTDHFELMYCPKP
jgi:hypothetical protein